MQGRPLLTAAAIVGCQLAAHSASAAGIISCQSADPDRAVVVEITVGQVSALIPVSVRIALNGQQWTTDPDGGATILQSFDFGDGIAIDLADANVERILFRLRLARAAESDDQVLAGAMTAVGTGAFAIICEGP